MDVSILPRGKDEFGNDTILFGDKPIRAGLNAGPRPLLALADVLATCGLHKKTNRRQLDLVGSEINYPFATSVGRRDLRVVDLDDAYRVAMQGRSDECRRFRDFIVDLLKRLEAGETINAKPAADPSPPVVPVDGDPILLQLQSLMDVRRVQMEHDAAIRAVSAKASEVEARVVRIEAKAEAATQAMLSLSGPIAAEPTKTLVDEVEQRVRW